MTTRHHILFLHIGHGKTGSSFLQAAFRLSRDRLAAAGVDYPEGSDQWAVNPATITSGNGKGLLASPDALRDRLAMAAREGVPSQLWSSEFLFNEIEGGDALTDLPDIARQFGFGAVRVLLFLRDPLGHAASGWQQGVKRHGLTDSVEEAFARFAFPERVVSVLDRLGTIGVETTVRNYSRCRDRLLVEAGDWLGVSAETLSTPGVRRVNRSLTRGELVLQREINRVLGQSGRLLADPLCERLPEIEADDLRPSLDVQEATWERLRPVIERINARLPEEHRYQADLRTPAAEAASTFSEDQLRVMAESLGGEIARLREQLETARGRSQAILADPAAYLGIRRLGWALIRRLGRRFLRLRGDRK